ncbi:hypothetical protein LCGC14_1157200 [marine sediment metagenome]|uniref:Uncharacterized protein n=1 Tax=marine sediment metagenome TaxID=412755 RepID=A0A0F9PBZ6_9ZZZZ
MTEEKYYPLDALERTAFGTLVYNGYSTHGRSMANLSEAAWKRLKPGALVERMPENIREGLRQLKSHHFDAMRMDKWRLMDDAYTREKDLSIDKMRFDRDILKIEGNLRICPQCEVKYMKHVEGYGLCTYCGYNL